MAPKTPHPAPVSNTDLSYGFPEAVSFGLEGFDEAIINHGVTVTHWRAMRCPVGLIDEFDIRRPHEDHEGCSNGFIYTLAGDLDVLFIGNNLKNRANETGIMYDAGVQVTLPRIYNKTRQDEPDVPVLIAPFDRIYLKEETLHVVHWQLCSFHASQSVRLHFPPVEVYDLIDSSGKRYFSGEDFVTTISGIKWLNSGPGLDPKSGKGTVFSIRFSYRPFFYCANVLKEVRVAQIQNPITGEREIVRMPQVAVLQREYNFLSETSDPKDSASVRRQTMPGSASFGPK